MHGTISLPASPALPRYSHILALDLGKFNSVLCNYVVPQRKCHPLSRSRSVTPRRRLPGAADPASRGALLEASTSCCS
jgi:hypothetical protein